jgi:ferrous iron transport protein A
MEAKDMVPLSQIDEGSIVRVVGVDAGRGLRSRLSALGLLPNARVRVIRSGRSGTFVISVKNSRMALGRGALTRLW